MAQSRWWITHLAFGVSRYGSESSLDVELVTTRDTRVATINCWHSDRNAVKVLFDIVREMATDAEPVHLDDLIGWFSLAGLPTAVSVRDSPGAKWNRKMRRLFRDAA